MAFAEPNITHTNTRVSFSCPGFDGFGGLRNMDILTKIRFASSDLLVNRLPFSFLPRSSLETPHWSVPAEHALRLRCADDPGEDARQPQIQVLSSRADIVSFPCEPSSAEPP